MKKIIILLFLSVDLMAQSSLNTKYLDKNKVKARINTTNDKFWNINGNGNASYEVPVGKGTHAMFANSLWIGGLDAGGQLHLSANTYKQGGIDFWQGPLDTSLISAFSASNTAPYNRLWKIDCNDINDFVNAFNNGSVTAATYTVPNDLLNYPAIGTGNFQKKLNPFMDAGNNSVYDPQNEGDYPIIKGHQQILSIYNDNYSTHTETGAPPMGLEIHERSYVYSDPTIHDSMQAINYTTFYHYTIYNRSSFAYHDVYLTDWSDIDVGNYIDDYIGSDTVNNFAYCYNGTANDPSQFGTIGYGNKPPVLSHAILPTDCSGDGIDNDQDGQIDEAGEQFKLNKVTYYNNNHGAFLPQTTNPSVAIDYYNFMTGFWKDNSPFTYGANAYGGTTSTSWVYTGDPQTNSGWTESTAGNSPGDRRILMSSGPFTFPANSKIEWGYALVFSQDTTQAVNTITQFNTRVKRDVKNIRYYDANHQNPQCAPTVTLASTVGIKQENKKELKGMLYPNPCNSLLTLDFTENLTDAKLNIVDVAGRIIMQSEIKNNYRSKIDLSTLENGIYFIELISEDKFFREKLIKN